MPSLLACLLFLLASSVTSYADWRVDAFSKAQEITREFEKKEADLMIKLLPETRAFFDLWLPVQDARRKIEDLAFRWHLLHDPISISWENPFLWTQGIQSSEDEKRLAAGDLAFSTAYKDYSTKRTRLLSHKELFKLRNTAYQKDRKTFQKLETDLQARLDTLQKQVDKNKKSNHAMQSTAGRRTASLYFMKTRPLQATFALPSGGRSCSR
jgi:hypothetical protein